jgi:Transcriptional regulatory protein, C terminal
MKEAAPLDSTGLTAVAEASNPEPAPLPECILSVTQSKSFEKSPTLRVLLTYLWQNRNEPISEYAIATEALGRSPMFNPKTDATVRVQISRLRQRLEKFYEQEGKDCAERLTIPLGSHSIQIDCVSVPVKALAVISEPALMATVLRPSRASRVLAWTCAVLLVTSVGLGVALYRSRASAKQGAVPEAARFWKSFFGNGRQSRIILPTPVFLAFSPRRGESVMFRDTLVNDFNARENSAGFEALHKLMGNPSLAQNYTVTSDTFASVKLARYLDRFSLTTSVHSSADAPLEALDNENMIAIGTGGTLTPLKPYMDRMSFVLGPHEQSVEFRKQLPGEPKRIEWLQESSERAVWPGVIAYLPGPGGRTRLLILASRHTSALVSFLTSANGLEQLDRMWKAKGSPDYYEVVVNSEMNGLDLVRFWPVALHPFSMRNTP